MTALTLATLGLALLDCRRSAVALKATLKAQDAARACLVTDDERAAALAALAVPPELLEDARALLDEERPAVQAAITAAAQEEVRLEGELLTLYRAAEAEREAALAARRVCPPIALPAGLSLERRWQISHIQKGLLDAAYLEPNMAAIRAVGHESPVAGATWGQELRVKITLGKAGQQ